MGYEGFSKPLPLARMHPVYGNKGEFLFLLGLVALVPLIKGSRKSNEDKLRSEVTANNRYADMQLAHAERQPSEWTAWTAKMIKACDHSITHESMLNQYIYLR